MTMTANAAATVLPLAALDVLEGVIVDDVTPALLHRHADPGSAPMLALPEVDEETLRRLGVHALHSYELSKKALADNTRRNYNAAWQSFVVWCDVRDVAPLPAATVVVGAYLTALAVGYDEIGQALFTDEGNPQRGKLRPQSMGVHLTAINRFHVASGLPKPGDSQHVQNVVRGIRRTFGVHKDQRKAALDLAKLERVIGAVRVVDPTVTRDRALAVLASRPAAGPGVLARLTCGRVEITRRQAIVRLPSPHRGVAGEVTLVFPATGDPATCPVAVLAAQLGAVAGTGLLDDQAPFFANGVSRQNPGCARAMSKPGIANAIGRLAAMADRVDLSGIPVLALRALLRRLWTPTLVQLRDEALLTTGWITASRRSNLTYLSWGQCVVETDRIVADQRWSKTNQDGEEEDTLVSIPISEDPTDLVNPGRAFLAWRAAIAELVGGAPEQVIPDWPVFVPIDRHGNVDRNRGSQRFQRLSGEAINTLVQTYVAAIGLEPAKYGAHSLRIGLVTHALQMGVPIHDIQTITKHKSVTTLLSYARAEERRTNDPARRLLTRRVNAAS